MDLPKIHQNFTDTSFNSSDVDTILLSTKSSFLFIPKTKEEYKETYSKFNQDLLLYLNKLPASPVKKYVSELAIRDLIYLGINQLRKYEGFFSRAAINDNALSGLVLDVKDLDIDITTGEAKNIDDCIYATYFSFIRASILLNKLEIRNDKNLHDLMSQYFYLIMSKILLTKDILPKQKLYIKFICYYAYYRYYLKEKFPLTVSILQKRFDKDQDIFQEFKPRFKDIEKYTSVKDLPKMFIDTKTLIIDPNKFVVDLLRSFKQYGFYCVLGPLDMLIALAITNKYPFELLTSTGNVNKELQDSIEEKIVSYMKKVKFSKDKL